MRGVHNQRVLQHCVPRFGNVRVMTTTPEHASSPSVDPREVRERTGVNVNPLTRKFSLQPSLQVNYMLCADKPNETA